MLEVRDLLGCLRFITVILRVTILNAVAANMLSNYECMFCKAGITEANSAFNMWSDDRYPAAAPTLADFPVGCRPTRPKTTAMPRTLEKPLKPPSLPPHKGPSYPASPLSYYT
jgi:hypothetical protein